MSFLQLKGVTFWPLINTLGVSLIWLLWFHFIRKYLLSRTNFIVTNEMWLKIATTRFINLTVIVTLSYSSFLWEYRYLLIPEICNLGHGNHHWVAISKIFTKRLLWIFKICFGRFYFRSYCVSAYFIKYFVQIIFQYHVCSFYIFVLFEYQTLRALDQLGSIFEIL